MKQGATLNDFMHWDNTIFDDVILNAEIDRPTLISTIMLRCGLQKPVYQNFGVFKSQVNLWFAAHSWNFDRLVKLIKEEYNPLWNKDGTVQETRTRDNTENETIDTDGTMQRGGSNTEAETINHGRVETHSGTDSTQNDKTYNETSTSMVKAFNASAWQDTDSNTRNGEEHETGSLTHGEKITESGSTGRNQTDTFGETNTTTDDTQRDLTGHETETYERKEFGNIGLTMVQQMFNAELDLLGGFNLYQWISDRFENDMMIGVY